MNAAAAICDQRWKKLPWSAAGVSELSGAELHHSYGPTETSIAATEWTCEAGAERV